ncbi:MAG: hypothetical protein SPH77_01290 [Campylobacter sp.]|uniref:hypothetical protein n=1 Tax=Campylobacter sp. TaxID=205 RepID=UPI002A917ACE|nr:hypothetical protein [Campylobacter sp.]MDY6187454.1 hypothetical protein [Campylobacter sp.]
MIKIEQNTTLLTSIEQKISGKNNEFSEILAKVEQFKKDLEELDPLRLAFKLNMDKIKEKIEEKRAELAKIFKLAELSGDEKARTIASIEEMLEAYKKQLLEQMQAAKELEDEKQAQKSSSAKVDVMRAFAFLDTKNAAQNKAQNKQDELLKSLL